MFQAKYRKVLWLLLMVHLILAHFFGLHRLWLKFITLLGFRFPFLFSVRIDLIWMAGIVLTCLWQLYSYEQFRRKALRGIEPIEETWIQGIHMQAAREAGLGVPLPMYRSFEVNTPMVIGFSSQLLLLPREPYSSASLRMILLHEYIHVKRGDIWYKLFFTVGTCLLWFQPLMYLLKWAAFRDVEIACDQRVVQGKGEADRGAYGQLLIDSLYRENRELPHSAYFYNSKAVMKARIAVVMDEREHLGYLGALLCLLLSVETGALVLTLGLSTARHRRTEPLVNIYEGYELPESFTKEAAEAMAKVAENGSADQARLLEEADKEQKGKQKKSPWQIENPYEYWRAVPDFLYRYLMYYENQEAGSRYEPTLSGDWNGGAEILDRKLLAENGQEYVEAVRFRRLVALEEEKRILGELPGAEFGYDQGCEYVYYDWALHIRRQKRNTDELAGVAELGQVLEACEGMTPPLEFELFTKLDLWQRPVCRAQTMNGVTEVTWDNGETWTEVPIAMEKLTARGDQLDGALRGPQEKSYVVSEAVTAFAYGGSPEVPVTVTCSPDQGITWNTSVVTYDCPDTRRLFLSFPDADHGFLIVTGGRAMRQEGKNVYRTSDGGKTWEETAAITNPSYGGSHSLLTGGTFLTPEVGFFTTMSSGDPVLYRTEDGGESWELQTLPDMPREAVKEYGERTPSSQGEVWETYMARIGFTMAYPPEQDGQILYLYLTQEEYSELGGEKARYRSEDLGETWSFDCLVLRK